MLLTSTFGTAIGASVMAQFGRDPEVLRSLMARAARYMFLRERFGPRTVEAWRC